MSDAVWRYSFTYFNGPQRVIDFLNEISKSLKGFEVIQIKNYADQELVYYRYRIDFA